MSIDPRRSVFVGENLRINGKIYTVNGTNSAHLQLKLKSNETMVSGAQIEINGNRSSSCIDWNAAPSRIAEFFETFQEFDQTTVFVKSEDNGKSRFSTYI